ncbi:STAS domain-containing protein [uncultured Pseudomonas sp.]|uniref:STAS domain-containing protein n=1 Tax=uncultured Pseudomonas sp. TaxID=114707 RepID=UPI0025D8EBA1|nr:STAS domain-containing protein [uncultured Pseudomonas sp.]
MFTLSQPSPEAPALLQAAGDLTIYEVQQAHEQLKELLAADAPAWQLDLSGIGELDSAGAQLLLALHQYLTEQGRPTEVVAASPSVMEMAGLLALDMLHPMPPGED